MRRAPQPGDRLSPRWQVPVLDPRRGRDLVVLLLLLAALQQGAAAALIEAKARLAPVLIERAWQTTLRAGAAGFKPWPWADTWPVARLRFPAQRRELPVLSGDSGHALAFAPGHAVASAPLGTPGLAVVGGHRDTHFDFLDELRVGDEIELELPTRRIRHYRVTGTAVVDSRRETLSSHASGEELLLVTCFPLDALRPGGPLRYVVRAAPAGRAGSLL